jgi:hypothetical protein
MMTLITEQEAVSKFPITMSELGAWKSSGELKATLDKTRGALFDEHVVEALVELKKNTEHDALQKEILGQFGVSIDTGPNGWEKASAFFSMLAAAAALAAIFVASSQFAKTRNALVADNEYRVWTDILQSAKAEDLAPVNDRLIAAKAMNDAHNLTDDSWNAILGRVCPSDMAVLDRPGNSVTDMKHFCGEYITRRKQGKGR